MIRYGLVFIILGILLFFLGLDNKYLKSVYWFFAVMSVFLGLVILGFGLFDFVF